MLEPRQVVFQLATDSACPPPRFTLVASEGGIRDICPHSAEIHKVADIHRRVWTLPGAACLGRDEAHRSSADDISCFVSRDELDELPENGKLKLELDGIDNTFY